MIYNHRFKKLGISHGKNSRVAKHVKNFLPKGFVSVGDDVVIKTLKDAKRGKDMSVYSSYVRIMQFFSKYYTRMEQNIPMN